MGGSAKRGWGVSNQNGWVAGGTGAALSGSPGSERQRSKAEAFASSSRRGWEKSSGMKDMMRDLEVG